MSTLRWALLALTILTLLVIASLTADSGGWSQDVRWARQRLDRIEASAYVGPVLHGEAVAGDVRGAYAKAGARLRGVDHAPFEALRRILEREHASRDEALAAAARLPEEALQLLRDATRIEGAMFRRATFGARGSWDPLYDVLSLVDGVLVRAKHLPDPSARVDEWLVALATGADLSGLEFPLGKMMGGIVLDRTSQVASTPWLEALPVAERRRVARALERVEPGLPVEVDLAAALVDLTMVIERGDPTAEDLGFSSPYQLWQYGFSAWHAGVERVGRAIEQLQAFERATPPNERWPERRERLQRLEDLDQQANPDLHFRYFGVSVACEEKRRENVAALRQLRVAVAESLGEQPPQLDDPLR